MRAGKTWIEEDWIGVMGMVAKTQGQRTKDKAGGNVDVDNDVASHHQRSSVSHKKLQTFKCPALAFYFSLLVGNGK